MNFLFLIFILFISNQKSFANENDDYTRICENVTIFLKKIPKSNFLFFS